MLPVSLFCPLWLPLRYSLTFISKGRGFDWLYFYHFPVLSFILSDKLYHIMLYTSSWVGFELTTSVVIGFDCIGSCKSKYHTITATMTPQSIKWFFKEFDIKLIHPCGNTIYIVMLDMIDGNQHFAIVVYAIQLINMYDIIIINMSVNCCLH
jgi:hypothetical protein